MNSDSTTQTVLFPEIFSKPVVVELDQEDSSSDGGALLLQAADQRLGLSEALAECLRDPRQTEKVTHSQLEVLRQRIFGIALGYPDANDAQGLAEDPIHKLLLGRDPVEGEPLASQPTLSRFENRVGRVDLYRMAETLADVVIERHRKRLRGRRVRRITLDFDPTDDPTHGQQEFTFFHGYYDSYCYLPLLGTMVFDGEREQYLICAMLRPGNSAAHVGLIAILRRVLERLWAAFPKARIRVRLDGGFGAPHVLDFLDENGVEYVVGLGATKPLKKRAARRLGTAPAPTPRSGHFAFGCSSSPPGSRSLCAAWSSISHARSRRTNPGCGSQDSSAQFPHDALTQSHRLCTVGVDGRRTSALRNIDFPRTCGTPPMGLPYHNCQCAT